MQKPKIRLKRKIKIILDFLIIAIISGIAISLLIKGLSILTAHKLNYNETGIIDYKVCYKKNNVFDGECLLRGDEYIPTMIGNIDIKFTYIFKASKMMKANYKYSVISKVTATDKKDPGKDIYEDQQTLLKAKKFSKTSDKFVIDESVTIDYKEYSSIINTLKKGKVDPFKTELVISLILNFDGKNRHIDELIKSSEILEIKIPLSDTPNMIRFNTNQITNTKDLEDTSIFEKENILYYSISGLLVLIDLILVTKFIAFIGEPRRLNKPYYKELDRILNTYKNQIKKSRKIPTLDDKNVNEVGTIEELISLDKPIKAIETNKGKKSWFIIIEDKEVYRFILNIKK